MGRDGEATMPYTTYNFQADVKKAGEKYDADLRKFANNDKELKRVQAERSKAVMKVLTEQLQAIVKAADKDYFAKIDTLLGHAQRLCKEAASEVDRMKKSSASSLSIDKVNGGAQFIKEFLEEATKENRVFGEAIRSYREGNPTDEPYKINRNDCAQFFAARQSFQANWKEFEAKRAKIGELQKQAEELVKTAKVLAGQGQRTAAEAHREAKELLQAVKEAVTDIGRKKEDAEGTLKMIGKRANDPKTTQLLLSATGGSWKTVLNHNTEAKQRLKTVADKLKYTQDRIKDFSQDPLISRALQEAKKHIDGSSASLEALSMRIKAATNDMKTIDQKLQAFQKK
jgi:hypothetical protein